jgi:glycosyltransferase involved in cell wall biosynthesis
MPETDDYKKFSLDLIVLTFNEEVNLQHCLQSVQGLANNLFVVDSGSNDQTVKVAQQYGAQVFVHPFINQADQFNWALDNLPIESEWVLRLDADEYLSAELRDEILQVLPVLGAQITGVYLNRRLVFLGRWIRYGGYYPVWLLRLFRHGKARSEVIEMDEHLVLCEGAVTYLENDFSDHNRKGLSDWLLKHEAYAERQARVLSQGLREKDLQRVKPRILGNQVERKRWLKHYIYGHAPLFLRAFLFFIYRYFFRLGFLDGMPGLVFHFLQACWYMFYIDSRIYEKIATKAIVSKAASPTVTRTIRTKPEENLLEK